MRVSADDVKAGALPPYVTMRRGRLSAASVQTTPLVDRDADCGTSTLSTDGQVAVREPTTARLLADLYGNFVYRQSTTLKSSR